MALGLISISVVAGLAVVAELLPLLLAAVGGMCFAVWAVYVIFSGSAKQIGSWPFFTIAALVLVLPLGSLVTRLPLQSLIDVLLFAIAPVAIRYLFSATKQLFWVRMSIAFLLLFFALACLSTVFGRSGTYAAVYQTIFNLKLYLMLGAGLAVAWNARSDQVLWRWVRWIWLLFVPFILLQWFAPSIDWALFPLHAERMHDLNPFLANKFPKLPGPFLHASMLATFTALLLGFCLLRLLFVGGQDCWLPIFGYGFVLVASGQRGETFSLLMSLLIVVVYFMRNTRWMIFSIFAIFALLGAGYLIMNFKHTPLYDLAIEWGLAGNIPLKDIQARAAFYKYSFQIASTYFPLGSGLGTFGGVGAQKFDLSMFEQLGFQRYYWYVAREFLVDTYWPNFIAEAGWFGAVFMLFSVMCLWIQSLLGIHGHRDRRVCFYWAMANVSATFILINSLTSPLAADPKYVWICWMFFGLANSLGRQLDLESSNERNKAIMRRKVLKV
ncbi:hypothetical protein HNQ59_002879 [Chitinivorax tropicus]|uniref:O-antigen ligase domain-containing protein n=1 Tax=Chitinivorax tropicus TaxID=714531 RepID=A0A840MR47_9PROT|nr:hypothetical protein [Chitinivorax tropicus]MBB5019577.1 hypothetical protein [Chitinivorax tropicus]